MQHMKIEQYKEKLHSTLLSIKCFLKFKKKKNFNKLRRCITTIMENNLRS